MIRAVIFDCFGVLVSEGWTQFRAKHFGHDKELLQQANDLMQAISTGHLATEDFFRIIEEMTVVQRSELEEVFYRNKPDDELFSWIRSHKKDYKIGVLSNIQNGRLQEMFSEEQLAVFDALALSGEMGVSKPDPRAFTIAAKRLGLAPEECVFVDDQQNYVEAARDVGMRALQYRTFGEFKIEIGKVLNQI